MVLLLILGGFAILFFQPFDVCVSPPLVVCPGTLKIGVQYRFPLKVSGEL